VPLSTAFVICEGLGVEAGVDKSFREAPIFYWLYTALIVVGAGLILLPGTPLVRIMVLSSALPGRGRNEGIRKTDCPLIACTDAGGHVDPRWLEELTQPLLENEACDMVIGNCRPDAASFFERCTFYVTIESPYKKQFIFLGGASIAFRKTLWETVEGYPEHLYPCEDKKFLMKVKHKGLPVFISKGGVVYWKSRSSFPGFFKQYFLYGRGDAEGQFVPYRYLLRVLFYGATLLCFWMGQSTIGGLLFLGYLGLLTGRGVVRLKDPRALFYLPVLFLIKDVSQMLGYVAGQFRRGRETH